MGFIAPLVLVGLGALAIPVLIHLIQRERKRVVEFPSLMFLRKILYQSVRRRRVRDWLLLAMRLAALALIVLAFARPFFRRSELAAAAQNGAREAVILVDTSYSMEYGDRWQKAKSAATDAIRGLGPGDRASLVFFSSGADVAVRSAADRGRLESGVAAAANSSPLSFRKTYPLSLILHPFVVITGYSKCSPALPDPRQCSALSVVFRARTTNMAVLRSTITSFLRTRSTNTVLHISLVRSGPYR